MKSPHEMVEYEKVVFLSRLFDNPNVCIDITSKDFKQMVKRLGKIKIGVCGNCMNERKKELNYFLNKYGAILEIWKCTICGTLSYNL